MVYNRKKYNRTELRPNCKKSKIEQQHLDFIEEYFEDDMNKVRGIKALSS